MDHRELGQQLELFLFSSLSPGCPIWLPKGNVVYSLLSEKIRNLNREFNYVEVRTPILWKSDLYRTSGHLQHFRENMFFVEGGEQKAGDWDLRPTDEVPEFALKPMNCPGHMLIYKAKQWSYRDLPVRIADQGVLHRNEVSGALGGLTRCRSFCQDDAHCFVAPETLSKEIKDIISMVRRVYKGFKMPVRAILSTRPDNFLGEVATWDHAEAVLEDALVEEQFDLNIGHKEGAFYGPKIDFIVKDSLERDWQTATIQLDFQLPERFELEYVKEDNSRARPIVVHRAIYGSFERFIGILLEHFNGALPFWLAPVQVVLLPLSEKFAEPCRQMRDRIRMQNLRAESDDSNNTLAHKIAVAQEQKIPYMAVYGSREAETNSISVRTLDGKIVSVDFYQKLKDLEIENGFAF